MKKDFAMPILVLSLICLLMSGALALGNSATRPIIEEAAAGRAEAARMEIIPAADEFVLIEAEGLPKTVTEAYGTANGAGFVFTVTATGGYGGTFQMLCGITPEGKIIQTKVLDHNETPGFGDKVFAAANEAEANGQRLDGVAGATVTSKAFKKAVEDAFEAFEIVKGGRP